MTDERSYRDQINEDLVALADKWRGRGMPGLAAILIIVNDCYNRELEGHLLSLLSSLTHMVYRWNGVYPAHEAPDADRTTRTQPTDPGRQRHHDVLGTPKKSQRRAPTLRVRARRR